MRLVIDLQACQSDNRHRGMGRYVLELARAMARLGTGHEIWIALNGGFPETIEPVRAALAGLVPQDRIVVWRSPGPVMEADASTAWRRQAGELVREAFLASLQSDVVLVGSLFEGFAVDALTSIGRFADLPTAVILPDLIPLAYSDIYLRHPAVQDWYFGKLAHLRRADLLLAISEHVRRDGIARLDLPESAVANIGASISSDFHQLPPDPAAAESLRRRHGIVHPFVMYTGGIDYRKNIGGLIQAFARLPDSLRRSHQLVVACGLEDQDRRRLAGVIRHCGLPPGQVLLVGAVTDADLIALYNACRLFVFPSWCEGFGLPVLEAMACGAAVIGSSTTSIPEVIGRPDALFDPYDDAAIAAKMAAALQDEAWLEDLRRHGLRQAGRFSWDACARLAWSALAGLAAARPRPATVSRRSLPAAIAEVPESPSLRHQDWVRLAECIAENQPPPRPARQLLVDVTDVAISDAGTGIQRLVRSISAALLKRPPAGFQVEPIYYVREDHAYRHARWFLRQPGVKASAADPFVEVAPGDLYIGLDLVLHPINDNRALFEGWRQRGVALYFIVYDLLPHLRPDCFSPDVTSGYRRWLASLTELADGVACISRAVADELLAWLDQSPPRRQRPFQVGWFHLGADIVASVPSSGFPEDTGELLSRILARPSFLMVGWIDRRKGHAQTLSAFEQLWREGVEVNLVVVGRESWEVKPLMDRLNQHPEKGNHLFWLGQVSDELLLRLYENCSASLMASEGEGFGLPLVEAAQHSLPIIARDIPVFRELAGKHASYFSGLEPEALAGTLRDWLVRWRAGQAPNSANLPWLTWEQSTAQLLGVMFGGRVYREWRPAAPAVPILAGSFGETGWRLPVVPCRQLLVDVSALAAHDHKTGIQRVVRSILAAWLRQPPPGFRLEPVYLDADGVLRLARRFTVEQLGLTAPRELEDIPAGFQPGDVFLGLDLSLSGVPTRPDLVERLRAAGVPVCIVVYDLIPELFAERLPASLVADFRRWLAAVAATADGVVCISQTVMAELTAWLERTQPPRSTPLKLGWFHLGADIVASRPSTGVTAGFEEQWRRIAAAPALLMVGSICNNKGYDQALAALTQLWAAGNDIRLVIVGREGWNPAAAKPLRRHPEAGRRLFWFEGASDEMLQRLYDTCSGLLVVSRTEGFCLPLIEAAQHRLPIIARNLPVIREVAGELAPDPLNADRLRLNRLLHQTPDLPDHRG